MLSSSITSAAATVRLTEMIGLHRKKKRKEKKILLQINFKNLFLFLVHLHVFLALQVLKSNCISASHIV